MTGIVGVVLCAGLSFVMATAFARAQGEASFDGTLHTIHGDDVEGRLVVDESGSVSIGGRSLPFADVASFERHGDKGKPVVVEHRVWLRSGHQIPASALRGRPAADGKPSALLVTMPCGLEIAIPATAIAAIRQGGAARPEPVLFAADRKDPPANEDVLYVQKDDKATRSIVTIGGLLADRVDFVLRGKSYDFPLAGVTAIVFGKNTGFAPDRQPAPRTSAEFVTGERLEGRLLSVGDTMRFRIDEGDVVEVQPRLLRRLRIASDRLVWLSDLQPTVEQTPAFDRIWAWQNDRSAVGSGIVIGGQAFERGIGLVPRTRLTYDLGGRFDLFEASIGIDDRGGPLAHAIFRVLVDDTVVMESQPKTLGMAAEPLRIELNKCKRLAIEVDFGKNYDLGDFCAFADARVVQR
ncbi:MAG: NPCBM/NEW2 domain-containing protein [Planctomycetes bacterium]|nr:NPCBM/NEW2 domain-containing protein [Planctomycetota bacterium]